MIVLAIAYGVIGILQMILISILGDDICRLDKRLKNLELKQSQKG